MYKKNTFPAQKIFFFFFLFFLNGGAVFRCFKMFFQLFKKKSLNTIFWWCIVFFLFSRCCIPYFVSWIPKSWQGCGYIRVLATPTETIFFGFTPKFNAIGMFRSLWCRLDRESFSPFFSKYSFFFNHWFFQIKSAHYCLFSTGCWRLDGDERTLFWLVDWFFVDFLSCFFLKLFGHVPRG